MDATSRAIAETLRRWYGQDKSDKVVPIERGIDYRLMREAREASRQLPAPTRRPTPPEFPGAA